MRSKHTDRSPEFSLERSNDYGVSKQGRSGVRHDLMDAATRTKNNDLWRKIGESLVIAFNRNDLTPQVSDHFVRSCPDAVFEEFADAGPGTRFVGWSKRAQRIKARKT